MSSDASQQQPGSNIRRTSGYFDFLEAWLDPNHDEHRAMRRWAGRSFDPEQFDPEAANKAIRKDLRVADGG